MLYYLTVVGNYIDNIIGSHSLGRGIFAAPVGGRTGVDKVFEGYQGTV